MRGMYLDPVIGSGLQPTGRNAAARKNKHMRACAVDYRQFKVAVIWRACDRLPLHLSRFAQFTAIGLDHRQKRPMVARIAAGIMF